MTIVGEQSTTLLLCHTEQSRWSSRVLNMRRVAAELVPRLLTQERRERHMEVCQELRAVDDLAFGDRTWMYKYDPEAKQKSSQWKSEKGL